MGQIKNIKLHIVTDIKEYRTVKMLRFAAQRCTRGVVSTLKVAKKCALPSVSHASIFLKRSDNLPLTSNILSISKVETLSSRCITTSSRNDSTEEIEEERANNIAWQDNKMSKIKINGLEDSSEEELHEFVMNMFIDAGVNEEQLDMKDIYRSDAGNVICTFHDRDVIREIFVAKKNLPSGVYVNPVLIRPFLDITYQLRVLAREKKIQAHGVYKGMPRLKLPGSSEWMEITHMQDLVDLELI